MRLGLDHAVGMDIDEVVVQEVPKGGGVARYLGPKPIPFRPGDRRHDLAAVLDRRLNAKVPVTDPRVVALQHQRAGGTLIAVERSAGDARDFHLIEIVMPFRFTVRTRPTRVISNVCHSPAGLAGNDVGVI